MLVCLFIWFSSSLRDLNLNESTWGQLTELQGTLGNTRSINWHISLIHSRVWRSFTATIWTTVFLIQKSFGISNQHNIGIEMSFISLNCFRPVEKQMQLSGNCFSRSCVCTRNVKLGTERPSHQTRPNTKHFPLENMTESSPGSFLCWMRMISVESYWIQLLEANDQGCKNIAFTFPVIELLSQAPSLLCNRKVNLPNFIEINSSVISWIKSDKLRISQSPFHSLEMAVKFCEFACGRHWGLRQLLHRHPMRTTATCWSLVIGLFPQHPLPLCKCALWPPAFPHCSCLHWTLTTNLSQPRPQPSQGHWNLLWAVLWASGDSKLSEPFSPRLAQLLSLLCCCFTVSSWGLLHTQASPRKQGTGVPFSWNPPQHTELLSSSPRDWSLLNKDPRTRPPEYKHWLWHKLWLWVYLHKLWTLCTSVFSPENGIYLIRLMRRVNELKYVMHLEWCLPPSNY